MPNNATTPVTKHSWIVSAVVVLLLAVLTTSAAGGGSLSLSSSPADGQTVAGSVSWQVTPSGGTPTQIDFLIDGSNRWTERYAPYVFNGDGAILDTRTLADGVHRLEAVAYAGGTVAARSVANVTVANAPVASSTGASSTGASSTDATATATPETSSRPDLAVGRPASSSSVESAALVAGRANDGDGSTRWSSAWVDNQWWQVDLGSVQAIDTVSINWEVAFARQYKIQVSTDGSAFTTAASESISGYGVHSTTFPATAARYVRVLGLTRATPYGFSAWSIQVFAATDAVPTTSTAPEDFAEGRPATSSSVEDSTLSAARANDDNSSTRWSSAWVDNQWWQVDLGSLRTIDTVTVNWENAYAKRYKIQVSANGSVFSDVAVVSPAAEGAKTTSFAPVSVRYTRILGLTRATPYGISTWDVNVTGPASPGSTAPIATSPPSVAGTARVGQTLQASAGTWSESPTSVAYRWQRCDSLGQGCTDIASATGTSYALTTADEGSRIIVVVTAENRTGSSASASAATEIVLPLASTTGSLGTKLPARLGQSAGAAFYVSSNGSDANAGSIDRPFATIAKAWSKASAGTTIYVRGGAYGGQINLTNKTASAASPITVRAYGSERVLLSGPSAQDYPAVYIWRTTGLRLQGFEVSNDAGDGIKVDSGWDIEIVGNDIHGNGVQGIIVGSGSGSAAPTYSKNVQIWANRIHDNGGWWSDGNPYALVGTHGVYYGNTGSNSDGIQHGAVGGVVANNLFYDQRFGYHLQVGSQNNGLVITNNTFDNASQSDTRAGNAVQIYGESNQFATKNVLVVNNIIAYDRNRGVYGSGPSMTSNVVRNNLTFSNPLGDIVPQYGSSTLFTVGAGNVTADPKFVDRTSKSYQLTSASPAIGRADADYAPAVDFAGRSRNGAPDLGAVEHGA